MSFILNIDMSSELASICLAREGESVALLENGEQKSHAAWIHPAIEQSLKQVQCTLHNLEAIAITAGPGSYTGLRVGMSTAKGLCYALNIPLITENTLRVLTLATKQAYSEPSDTENFLFGPMLDARRMEVYSGLFNWQLEEVVKSSALVLENNTFSQYLNSHKVIFSGDGSKKFQRILTNGLAEFLDIRFTAVHLAVLSHKKFLTKEFSDIAYAEPLYLKEFYTVFKK